MQVNFDNLDRFYIAEKNSNKSYTITGSLKSEYKSIASEISVTKESSFGETMIRILPPRLTSQKWAKFLGEIDAVWIIEVFHKVPNEDSCFSLYLLVNLSLTNFSSEVC